MLSCIICHELIIAPEMQLSLSEVRVSPGLLAQPVQH